MERHQAPSRVDFTDDARESFYGAVDDPYFRDRDYALIYDALKNQMRLVPFGDYLKRYIYRKAGLRGDYREIPLAEYQAIIRDSFADRATPASFTPTTARLAALAKNWLTQQTVKRSVVLLLGFGLGMPLEDVNAFLTKALREQVLNPKDPVEVICWYCYKFGYGYPRFEALWERFQALPEEEADGEALYEEHTTGVWGRIRSVNDDGELMRYLRKLRRPYIGLRQSVAAREAFDRLYAGVREAVARVIDESTKEDRALLALRMRERLSNSDRLYDYEKNRRVSRQLRPGEAVKPEDVTPADIERIICSAIPVGKQGNLMPARASDLNAQFSGKRFSRQRIGEVLAGRSGVDRFDLITLNFLRFACDGEACAHAQKRYSGFIESMNRILEGCGMGRVYIANPYECFILMCLLSDDPLGTYADVLEVSYHGGEQP